MKTVLVVDDDKLILKLIEMRLKHAGYAVVSAGSGADALAMDTASVDAVVCDFTMPSMTGLQVLEGLRAQGRTMPFVLISAAQEPEGVHEILEKSNGHFLSKPVDIDRLLHVLPK